MRGLFGMHAACLLWFLIAGAAFGDEPPVERHDEIRIVWRDDTDESPLVVDLFGEIQIAADELSIGAVKESVQIKAGPKGALVSATGMSGEFKSLSFRPERFGLVEFDLPSTRSGRVSFRAKTNTAVASWVATTIEFRKMSFFAGAAGERRKLEVVARDGAIELIRSGRTLRLNEFRLLLGKGRISVPQASEAGE